MTAVDFLRYALSIGALQFSEKGWVLNSGRRSPYFFNTGLFCSGDDLKVLGKAYATAMAVHLHLEKVKVYGPPEKGTAIAIALTIALGADAKYVYGRKEAKTHGDGGVSVGASMRNEDVLIVDDVITSGESCLKAMEVATRAGAKKIVGCLVALDRQERISPEDGRSAVQAFSESYDLPVWSVATAADMVQLLKQPDFTHLAPDLERILEYQALYGAA